MCLILRQLHEDGRDIANVWEKRETQNLMEIFRKERGHLKRPGNVYIKMGIREVDYEAVSQYDLVPCTCLALRI